MADAIWGRNPPLGKRPQPLAPVESLPHHPPKVPAEASRGESLGQEKSPGGPQLVKRLLLLHQRFPCILELFVESVSLFLNHGWAHKIKIEQFFEHIQRPFRLARFHIENHTRLCAFHWMGGKVAYIPNGIN